MASNRLIPTRATLKRLIDERSWKRGVDYYANGAVYALLEDGDTLHATVRGQQNDRVQLRLVDGKWNGACTCPMADEGFLQTLCRRRFRLTWTKKPTRMRRL